jgi:RimJ/RimL family protein N-acetyltransferase
LARAAFDVPERLESPRLWLRTFQDDDWRALHEYYSDEVCTRYTLGRVLTEGESWRLMAGMIGHWQLRGYGPYALEDKSTGAVVGVCGLWYPNDFPEREIKWGLLRRCWGQGFAREAAAAVLHAAHHAYPTLPPISFIHADNRNSIRVALSLGAVLERETEFRGARYHLYRHRAATAGQS